MTLAKTTYAGYLASLQQQEEVGNADYFKSPQPIPAEYKPYNDPPFFDPQPNPLPVHASRWAMTFRVIALVDLAIIVGMIVAVWLFK